MTEEREDAGDGRCGRYGIPLFQRVGAFGPESESDGETDAERSFVLV